MKRNMTFYALLALLGLVFIVLLRLGITYSAMFLSAPAPEPQGSRYEGTPLNKPAPGFELTDQNGYTIALLDLKDRVVVLAFLDSQCSDICPLTALHFRNVSDELGSQAERVVFLGVNVNAAFNSVEDVKAATEKWGAEEIPNWHYLTGNPEELQSVWTAYGIDVQRSPDEPHEVLHTPGLFVIDAQGQIRRYISPISGESWEGVDIERILIESIRRLLEEAG